MNKQKKIYQSGSNKPLGFMYAIHGQALIHSLEYCPVCYNLFIYGAYSRSPQIGGHNKLGDSDKLQRQTATLNTPHV